MSEGDARFEDVGRADRPVRLRAETVEDLGVISALVQDAVFTPADVTWVPRRRRLLVLLRRFRWEDRERAERAGRAYERVQSVLSVEGVERVRASGIAPGDRETVCALLAVGFETDDDPENPGGRVRVTLAGDGEIVAEVECLEAMLADVTRPYVAPSGRAPEHGD